VKLLTWLLLLMCCSFNAFSMQRSEVVKIVTSKTYDLINEKDFVEAKNDKGQIVFRHTPTDSIPILVNIMGPKKNVAEITLAFAFTDDNAISGMAMLSTLSGAAIPEIKKETEAWVIKAISELANTEGGNREYTSNNKRLYIGLLTNGVVMVKIILTDNAFNGVYPKGIAAFLYSAKHEGSLNEGINYVFWSELSKKSKRQDKMFEATQLVDGYIIYELSDWHNDEAIDFTIAVLKNENDLFLKSQTLRNKCHIYTGNLEFKTLSGGTEIIPTFKPLPLSTCLNS